jgi:hypothetical protein
MLFELKRIDGKKIQPDSELANKLIELLTHSSVKIDGLAYIDELTFAIESRQMTVEKYAEIGSISFDGFPTVFLEQI